MATKLGLLNGALIDLGARTLLDTGEGVEAARVLLTVYDRVIADCLSRGSWNFATETVKAAADTGVTPEFGYSEVFAKPSDWVRTVAVSEDEYFTFPLLSYYDDVNYWSADSTPIYIRYVSNDTGMGLELTRWTDAFTRFVELELASRTCYRLTQDKSLTKAIMDERDKARRFALNRDAMDESQPKFPPPGSWTQSRSGRINRGDRGNRNSLIG